jgi:hypothetical protein
MGIFTVNLGGTVADIGSIKYGFNAPDDAYKNIGSIMGVSKAKASDSGIVYGCNSPRPAQVRINFKKSAASAVVGKSNRGSTVRFCEPDKIGDVTLGGAINGKKVQVGAFEYTIERASIKSN